MEESKHVRLPTPPKPGEIMHCQFCGKPMLPEQFSKVPFVRKREFKWQIHEKCMMEMESLCDRQTPGLVADRQQPQLKR